jgi:hypothetical protein
MAPLSGPRRLDMVLPWQCLADETGKITCRNRPAQRKTKQARNCVVVK